MLKPGLDRFVDTVAGAGVSVFYIHARKAWLNGLKSKRKPDKFHRLIMSRLVSDGWQNGVAISSVILNGGLAADQAAAADARV